MRATVMTRRGDRDMHGPVAQLVEAAKRHDVQLCMDADEAAKHNLDDGTIDVCPVSQDVDICIVLGGDGTILGAMRAYAETVTPVFAVNFGEVGFLATMDPDGIRGGPRAGLHPPLRHDGHAGRHAQAPGGRLGRLQRHLRPPAPGPPRRRPRLRDRRGGDRARPLRRPRGRDPGRLDGLQPRQRRPRAGLGRGGLRRLLHRAALLHCARTGSRARRRADDQQPRARRRGRGPRRRPADLRAARAAST